MLDWQAWVTFGIIAVAAAYVVWFLVGMFRMSAGAKKNCGGCGGCSANPSKLVTLEDQSQRSLD
ncbi:MAG: FeoB-associated Cys-rich membrane protein [Pirellulaceae bacterium]|nr:FeoB-associated Cys-rich membrane protein [Pirellulaceae bacterium]